jgi:hypothetical protein
VVFCKKKNGWGVQGHPSRLTGQFFLDVLSRAKRNAHHAEVFDIMAQMYNRTQAN